VAEAPTDISAADRNLLADAVAAVVREAAAMAMARWRTDFTRTEKSDGSPVCEVDLDVDRMLYARLTALLPDAEWLSEETADSADRLSARRVWVVDPIDGTRDYIRGRAGWCVSVALVEDGRVVIALLDAPARGEVWRAVAGGGATLNGALLRAGGRGEITGARVPADVLPKVDRDLVAVEKPNSIALRMAMVAADCADLVATMRWGNEWDIAAAALVAEEAGASVTDALGAPLLFNKPDPHAFGVLTSTRGIHAAAVARLAGRAKAVIR
jgi:myo-inositol-1(or 4)-monophosphatase